MPSYAYFQKKFVPLEEAKIGIMTHALHYGTAIFEGIRGNWNSQKKQTYIFRLKEHYERLARGCRVLKINLASSVDELCQLTVELVAKCGFQEDIYIRPVAFKSSQALGVRLHNLDDDFFAFVIPWGPYLDCDKARCCVSSWHRPEDNVIPPQIKAAGIYINNALAKTEAISNGFDEAIMLSPDGHVSEGSGENIFLVIDGKLVTPASQNNILIGITRNTVIELAEKELGIETVHRAIDRSELYTADECFLTGTAAHVTPVAEVDHRPIGNGEIGEITRKLQEIYARVIRGEHPGYMHWCTPVYNSGLKNQRSKTQVKNIK
ncbi:MAG: branched chain amino acid aminotransferase [Chloroflexi bacterium RBG_16_56_11]|nr:MAG: branched chain amino acid aminotransferase [Chloroflexi bacterium RBG_16_56_11]